MSLQRKGFVRKEVLAAVEEHGGVRPAARALGCDPGTVRWHIRQAGVAPAKQHEPANPKHREGLEVDTTNTAQTITSVSATVRTLDDALKVADADMRVWEVERHTINKWDSGRKTDTDEWDVVELWQVKVWLRRRPQAVFIDPLENFIDEIRKKAPKRKPVKRTPRQDPHLLVLGLMDAHFGKLAWAAETGTNYDLDIAESVFADAFTDLIEKISGYAVEQIAIPIGQDFFHIDNPQNATVNGTPQDVDGRRAKMFNVGVRAMQACVEACLKVAPVKLFYSPGNHDRETSWYMTRVLEAYYHDHTDVTVDALPTTRKYIEYGVTLLGFDHGDCVKPQTLPQLMAAEQREAWARVECCEWLTGHWHKKKEERFTAGDTHVGVVVRVLPSLSGTDAWHYRNGYVHGRRAAEAYLYSWSDGYVGHFNANVRKGNAA